MSYYDYMRYEQYLEEDRLSKQADKINKALAGQLYQGESHILNKIKEEIKWNATTKAQTANHAR